MATFFTSLWQDKHFWRMLVKISLPIVLQNFISASLNVVDTIMIGQLGETPLAAVGVAAQYFFFFTVLVTGLCGGYCIFIAQYWGKRDRTAIKRYLGVMLLFALALGLIFTIFGLLQAERFISLFDKDSAVINLGAEYLRILAISTLLTALTCSFSSASRSIENAFLPMFASSIALALNTFLNYILIFGHFGLPALGVKGAAIATLIARIVEMAIIVLFIYLSKNTLALTWSDLDRRPSFILGDVKTVLPVLLNELCWGLGVVVYTAAYGRIGSGTDALATIQIGQTVQNLFVVLGFGLSGAAAAMIGAKIGEGDSATATIYAKRAVFLGVCIGLILAIIIFFCAPSFLIFFNVTAAVAHDAIIILKVLSLTITLKMVNIIMITGVMRGGGDVVFSLLSEGCTMWFIGVPLSFVGALLLHWPVYAVFALIALEEVAKFLLGLYRLLSNKWIHNLVG